MRQHPLFFYFLLAYAISWILSVPAILAEWGLLPHPVFNLFFIIKSFGPALAAFILTNITDGQAGVLNLRRRLAQWRVGWPWYVFILLGMPAVMLLGAVVLPGVLASFQGLKPVYFAVSYLINFVLIFFAGGPLGEEPGWRGFALPRMQTRYGALRATLLLGVMWTFWHLPDFLTSAQGGGPAAGLSPFYTRLPIFFLMVMALAFVFTWVFNHTGGSVFIALLLHAVFNTFAGAVLPLFSAPIVTSTDLPVVTGVAVLAILIAILTRGQLGYQPGQEQPRSLGEVGVH
jgi:membrane protease YdiL (CAAX protease family)